MKRRIFALSMLAILLLGMLVISGCGSEESGKTKVVFGHTMGQASMAIVDKYIAEFEKLYPDIDVEQVNKGGWSNICDTIVTEINGGLQPTIVYCYPDHVAMYNLSRSVVVLDDLINSTKPVGDSGEILGLTAEQKADFIESYYAEGTVFGDGKMYTLPFSKSTEILFYDKTFFAENNLKVPTTWAELWDVCAKIKALDPTCIPLGYDSADNWFITMAEQMNVGYTDASKSGEGRYEFNNSAMKDFVKELRGYYEKGYFTTKDLYGNYTSGLFTNQDPSKARCYLCIGSSGGTRHQTPKDPEGGEQPFEVGIAPIPQYSETNKKAISQGPSVCLLKGSKISQEQIEASWLFVKYLCTSTDFQAEFSMDSGYMPVLKSAVQNEKFATWLNNANGYENLNALAVKVGIEERDTYYTSDAFVGSSVARKEVGALLNKIMSTKSSELGGTLDAFIDKAFQDAIDECVFQAG